MDARLSQPWASGSGSTSAQPMIPTLTHARSRSGSSGSDASDGSSLSGAIAKHDIGTTFINQPPAPTVLRNGAPASASASGSGSTRGRTTVGPGRAADKGKASQAGQPTLTLAPGAAGQAKGRRKREGEGKRKKVAKACLVCQRSHLTCDEKRPCTRCVKKGIADQCVEGVRKKAKYLMEGEAEEAPDPHAHHAPPAASISPAASSTQRPAERQPTFSLPLHTPTSIPPPSAGHRNSSSLLPLPAPTLAHMGLEDDIWLAPQIMAGVPRAESPGAEGDPGRNAGVLGVGPHLEGGEGLWGDANLNMFGNGGFDFGTSASNEYQMLDAMLNSMSPVFPFDLPADNSLSFDTLQPHNPPQSQPHAFLTNPLNSPSSGLSMLSGQPDFSRSHSRPTSSYPHTSQPPLISPHWPIQPTQSGSMQSLDRNGSDSRLSAPPAGMGQPQWSGWNDQTSGAELDQRRASGSAMESRQEPGEIGAGTSGQNPPKQTRMKTGAEVYHSVIKPFDYTEGYHRLMEHISRNYQQKEVLRVVKALAVFRPSLIALQMPMSEEDEVFLERSFQRTLIELEKLISYSATPTAVWRRTGEMVYANPEFCGLIGKQQDELLTGRTYVYQIFAKQSAIQYWENFSVHAFENTTQNFFQATTLEVGDVKLATSCCFTIRRDVFDLPSVIIGQFLPIPTDI